jgi:acyl transferase domain-containing protein/NADP-dependent 3-hydroxy acid dehydrogenase YdfG/acyl carrier protein
MPSDFPPIAVTGVSAIFPGSTDAYGFWRDILAGRDLITDVPDSRWLAADHYDPDPKAEDKTYCKRGSFLGEIDFDPIEFGVQPAAISATDTCQLLALIAARQVLDDAIKNQFREIDRERASVILGVTSGQQLFLNVTCRLQRGVWMKALRESNVDEAQSKDICDRIVNSYVPWQENTFPGLLGNVVAGRIANRFNLGGTNCVIDAACASSLSALAMACDELHLGHSDLVITGGADTFNDAPMFVAFSKTPALSRSGDCRPFSDKADGTILGEGVSLFALRRLEDAERDGNRIYAVIKGLGSSSDGRSKSIYAPVPEGQAKALRRCYQSAGFGPETVGMVEAHGTGTTAGDAAEFEGLRQVFTEVEHLKADDEKYQWCALGSVKSQIGHTKAAAGAANLFKVTMALHHKVLPPTIKVDKPNPKLNIEQSPFYLNTQARNWVRPKNTPRRASLSSFGFGGTNFHVAMEEYEGSGVKPPRHWNAAGELVLLSAETPDALNGKCRAFSALAGKDNLAELARNSQLAFDSKQPQRLAIVCDSLADLKKKLDPANRAMPGVYSGSGTEAGRTAFMFPGQGSQYLGMTNDIAMAFEEAREAWDTAPWLGDVVFPRPVYSDEDRKEQTARLTQTEWAQPAIGTASVAVLNILKKLEVGPDCVGGHSFGEITALYASGGADFDTMVNIARKRGELMAGASDTPGGMLSVRHGAKQLREWISEWGVDLAVANLNGPNQTVLSGSLVAIEEAEGLLKQHGNGVFRLPVSTAFHSPLVAGAADAFRAHLDDCYLTDGALPFYANFDGELHPVDPAGMRDRLADQVSSSVRFHEMVDRMYEDGVRTFVEVGPSAVLSGLVKNILGNRPYNAIALDRQGTNGVVALWHGLGQLAVLGVPMNWAALRKQHDIQPEPRGQEKKFIVKINGGNYGRPYPDLSGKPVKPFAAPKPAPQVAALAPPAPKPVAVAAPAPPTVAAPKPVVTTTTQTTVSETTELYRVFQESIGDAHRGWQTNLARGHEDYLKAMESAYFAALGAPVAPSPVSAAAAPVAAIAAYVPPPAPAPKPVAIAAPPPQPAPVAVAPKPAPKPAAPAVNVHEILWNLVADKTGYPADMLEPTMALEADLGIDSIKRVEIFAAVQDALPNLPELPHSDIGRLRTLEDIAVYLQEKLGATPSARAPVPTAEAPAAPSIDINQILLGVIADKTGYPAEMLNPTMALEADLGIDSIKRVEIFAAVQDAIPGLPELPHSDIGRLRTLEDIAVYLTGHMGGAPAASPAATQTPGIDMQGILLEVIAEKTGYPVEMLNPGMALEADLGIDSIKRVEIFAAMSERVPGMKEPDMGELGPLKSIADVAAYLQGGATAPTPAPAKAPAAAKAKTQTGLRHAVVIKPAPATGHSILNENIGSISITDDGLGIADALSELLIVRGYEAAVSFDVPEGVHAVICLAGLREFPTRAAAIAANVSAFDVARSAASTIADNGLFVTVQDTGGRFEPTDEIRAWAGGLTALAKTAALEWPKAAVKAIDIEVAGRTPLHVAQAILNELLQGGTELEVGLNAKGERVTVETVSGPVNGTALALGPDSVIVASGGARGVTAQSLITLAKQTHSRFVLLGRTPVVEEPSFCQGVAGESELRKAFAAFAKAKGETMPPAAIAAQAAQVIATREVNEVLVAFKTAGSEARYIAVDIRDRDAVSKALAEVRAIWGPISGVVHGAGVLADKRIAELTPDKFDLVFSTKIDGLEALLDATRQDPLKFIALFSSVAARNGNPGQAAYAMANEVMNRVAHAEAAHRAGLRVKSLNWGPWDGGMVTPALRRHFEQNGVSMLGIDEGTKLFSDEILRGADGEIEIVLGHPFSAA